MNRELPTCPRCEKAMDFRTVMCRGCGLTLAELDEQFGDDCVVLDYVTDTVHVLRSAEKAAVVDALERFERRFPQLFCLVFFGALPPAGGSLRLFGFWMLNRAAVTAVDFTRPNENGLLLLVDVRAKAVGVTLGYAIEPLLTPKDLTAVLRRGRHRFAARDFRGGVISVVSGVSDLLARRLRGGREAGWRPGESATGVSDDLSRLPRMRRGHRPGRRIEGKPREEADE